VKLHLRSIVCMLALLLVAACGQDSGKPAAPAAEPEAASTEAAPAPEAAQPKTAGPAAASVLAGTSWQLVKIMSMDDSVDEPEDGSPYRLEFKVDGSASIKADCNRGSGSWTSAQPGQLQFGPIAATMAMCPPGSLSEKYLAQFEWVRSYVLKDGRLFLATMADGSIIEFARMSRAAPVAAIVLGEEIHAADAGELQDAVLRRLFDWYAVQKGITVADGEVDAFVTGMQRGMAAAGLAAEDDLTPEETAQVDAMRREMGRAIIRQWKINKALYEQYGGRIVYQQLGPEPLDAYRTFLDKRQQAGDLQIGDPQMAVAFWRYFTDESIHDFMEPGSEDEARAFSVAPWEQQP